MSADKVHLRRMVCWLIFGSVLGLTGCNDEPDEVLLDTEPILINLGEHVLTFGDDHPAPSLGARANQLPNHAGSSSDSEGG